VVLDQKIIANTTPSARSELAAHFFIERASTPPRLRRGVRSPWSASRLQPLTPHACRP